MAIWRTDASGQLGRNNQDQDPTRIIGPYTYQKETEKGNVQRLYKACEATTSYQRTRGKDQSCTSMKKNN